MVGWTSIASGLWLLFDSVGELTVGGLATGVSGTVSVLEDGALDAGVVGKAVQGTGCGESTLGIGVVDDVLGATEFTRNGESMSDDVSSRNLSRVLLGASKSLPTSRCKKVCVGVSWDSAFFVIWFLSGLLFVGVVAVLSVMLWSLVINRDGGTSGTV